MRDHKSPSQVDTFNRCGLTYFYRYIENLKIAPGIALIKGGAVGKGVELNLQSVIDNGAMMRLADVKDAVSTEYDKRIGEDGLKEDDKEKIGPEKDSAITLSELHYTDVAPKVKPIAVERAVAAIVNDEYMIGYEDYCEGKRDDKGTIIAVTKVSDLKTRSATRGDFKQDEIDNSIQGIFYAYCEWLKLKQNATDGEVIEVPEFQLDGLVATKTPKVSVLSKRYDENDFEYLRLNVAMLTKACETGVFHRCSPGFWACSPKWCGYYETICPFGRRKRVIK